MTAKLKTKVQVHGVPVINRHSFNFGRFKELIRFDKRDSVFKKWDYTVRFYNTKPFANGFITYKYE